MDADEIIRRCPLLRQVDQDARARLAEIAWVDTYTKGHRFFRVGAAVPGLYIVASGLARVYQLSPAGKEYVLHLPGPGQTFGEVAVLGGFPAPANSEMLEDGQVLLLPATELQRQLDQDHRLCRQILTSLSHWVRHVVGLIEDIALRDALGRLARWMLEHADDANTVQLPMAKRHLASHLALTPETFSRCLRRLEDAGVLRNDDSGLHIADRDTLTQLAEGLGPVV